MKNLYFLVAIALFSLAGCIDNKEQQKVIVLSENDLDVNNLLADTIIYSVDIVNTDTLDTWADWRLRHLNTQKLISEVFDNVYKGKLKAYDYFTDAPLTIDDIKAIEKKADYDRSLIEEIQFEETWLFSPKEQIFHKEVHSFVLAYALYAGNGERMGLKPVFRVRLEK